MPSIPVNEEEARPRAAGTREDLRVFIMDTWAYPYRLPVFERLNERVEVETFFSRPQPFDHVEGVSLEGSPLRSRSGRWLFALAPVHLLWRRYDVYMVGQIGVESVVGAFFTLLMARLRRKPLVLWTDYIETETYRRNKKVKRFFGDFIRRNFIRHCAAAMAFGSYTENYLKKISGGRLRVFSVAQAVPESCNADVQAEDGFGEEFRGKVLLLYLGYLRKSKGGDFLIRCFREMGRSDAMLLIVGSGEEEERWKALAGDSEYIRFLGHVEGKEKARCYAHADVFVMPTEHDTWGLVVNEAMYYGLPIVVTDAAGASELISDNGIVVECNNANGMKTALTRLIEDECLRREMGEKSRAYIARYGVEYAADSFMRVIRYVSGRASGATA